MNPAVRQLLMAGPRTPVSQIVTVACGNSISAQSKYQTASTSWLYTGELGVANVISGSPLRFKRTTDTTYTDGYGVHGHGGATLDTINSEIATEWIAPINTAGFAPDLVVGLALLENDVAAGATVAAMTVAVETWIAAVRAAWPAAKILLCTPRPSFSYNTAGLVANYQAISAYILGRANNRDLFAVRLNGYEDPTSPGNPLAGYTDSTVHPNARGALVNARTLKPVLERLSRGDRPFAFTSNNQTLTGSTAATGTGVSGTMPAGSSFNGGSGTANGTYVSQALNPGWRVTFANNAAVAHTDLAAFSPGAISAASPPSVSAYAKLRIVSGAANLRAISLEPRLWDAGGNTFRYYLRINSGDADMDWMDGDVLTFVAPPTLPNSGAFNTVTNHFRPFMKATTSPATVELIEQGFYTVP